MSELWFLFFLTYIGVVWITILHKLKRIEKLLSQYKNKNNTPDKIG